jgi:PAS domain S-box-containing protein
MAKRTIVDLTYKDLQLPNNDIEAFKLYFGLSAEDERRLGGLQDLLKEHYPTLLEEFYNHLLSHSEAKQFFNDPATLQRVKKEQASYFEELTAGQYDAKYLDSRLAVGVAHDGINLPLKWFVGAFAYYADLLADRLKTGSGKKLEEAFDGLRSIMKLILFDMALSTEAFIIQRQRKFEERNESVREAEEFMRSLLDAAVNIAIYGISSEGTVQSWNKGAENLIGFRSSEIIGQDFRKLFPQEEVEGRLIEKHFREVSEKGIIESTGWRLRKGGGKFLARFSTAVVKDAKNKTTGYVEIVRDETERLLSEQRLEDQRREIADLVGVLSGVTDQISLIGSELSSSTAQSVSAVEETMATSESVRTRAEQMNRQARGVSQDARGVVEVSRQGQQATDSTLAGMIRITEQMESIANCMDQLTNQSQLIGDIINTVDDLSQQSNLLAINASIEAAKAGEQGKGFAVVAEEVKNLSQQSKDATSSVRGILNEIVKATRASTKVIEQGNKAVEAGHQEATNAGSVIKTLSDSIEKAAKATEVIEESSQQQVVGLQQVVDAMDSIQSSSQRNFDNATRLESAGKELMELGRRLVELTKGSRNGDSTQS